MTDGKVLAAARTKGFHSLARVAQALVDQQPELFEGVEARSLAAKLSELNRDKLTWWRSRHHQLKALQELIGIEPDDLVASDSARRRGLWVCKEFPELPALNLAHDLVLNLAEPVCQRGGLHPSLPSEDLDGWMRVGLKSDYAQHPMARLKSGVQWLHVPRGIGRHLLLERFKARGRLNVVEAETLGQAVTLASRSHPVVLAPSAVVSAEDLEVLAQLGDEQPVLVVSTHALPVLSHDAAARASLPSWDWLAANHADRARSAFMADAPNMSGGLLTRDPLIGFRMQLVPTWRDDLLKWIEQRFTRRMETLYSAEGLRRWLDGFDPDHVTFPTPAAVLSLARICHEVGERRLPNADNPSAGMLLVQRLGRTDSRYQNTLARLVCQSWLDVDQGWEEARPWDHWCKRPRPTQKNEDSGSRSRRPSASIPIRPQQSEDTTPSEGDLDVAVKAGLLRSDHDGRYGLRSYAEAVLVLRDQLRRWMLAGEIDKWAPQTVGDLGRQRLADDVLRTLSNRQLLEMSTVASGLPVWSAAALGASEALFITMGLRMAAGKLNYSTELKEFLDRLLIRCMNDEIYIQLPLSRSNDGEIEEIDWLCAAWGWSLVAPKPAWVPAAMAQSFPGWADGQNGWQCQLPIPKKGEPLVAAHARRMAQAIRTAVDVSARVGAPDSTAPASLMAIVSLVRAAHGHEPAQSAWWEAVGADYWWAPAVLASLLNPAQTPYQYELAASLLDACGDGLRKNSGIGFYSILRSPLWQQILETKDAAELFDRLTPGAILFVISHLQTVPYALREHVARVITLDQVPATYNWHPLVQAADATALERLNQMMAGDFRHSYSLASALWSVCPHECVQWATDPDNPKKDIFFWQCPSQWVEELTYALLADPERAEKLNVPSYLLTRNIYFARAAAPALLSFLSTHRAPPSVDME